MGLLFVFSHSILTITYLITRVISNFKYRFNTLRLIPIYIRMEQEDDAHHSASLRQENQLLKEKIAELNNKIVLYERQIQQAQNQQCVILVPVQQFQPQIVHQLHFIQPACPPPHAVNIKTEPSNQPLQNDQTKIEQDKPMCKTNRKYEMTDYFNASDSTKYRFRAELRSDLSKMSKKIQNRGLRFANIKIIERPSSTDQHDFQLKILPDAEKLDPNMLFLNKEETRLSDKAYHKFRKVSHGWPSLYKARQFRKNLNEMFPVTKTEHGVYNNPKNKIQKMIEFHRHQLQLESNKIQIKLSADGAQIGKKAKLLNFTFSFLQQYSNNSHFVDANFTLGIFDNDKEDHDSVESCFKDLFTELANTTCISLGEVEFSLEYFFAADAKMLALLLGVNAANSNHPCLYCKCPSSEFHNTSKVWSITNVDQGARTYDDACKNVGSFGQKHKPLINFIPFSHFVFDLLHANLRISDLLFENFFNKLVTEDLRAKTSEKQDMFIKCLNEEVRIFNPVYEVNKKIKLKNFNRNENLRIFSQVPLSTLFPDMHNIEKIERIWRLFYEINTKVIDNKWTSDEIRLKTQEWVDLCVEVNGKSFPTLYMHMLSAHLHQLNDLHGLVNRFNCQQLEKKNHENSKTIFQSTNMHTNMSENDDYLVQLINKNNRIEMLKKYDGVSDVVKRCRKPTQRKPKFLARFRKNRF